MENKMTFGFIGVGNMGSALAKAVAKSCGAENVFIADPDTAKTVALASTLGCRVSDNTEIAKLCDYIVLGVKPQMMGEVLGGIAELLKSRRHGFCIISMAAGLSTEKILGMIGARLPIIRIMPNTPAAIGKGVILYNSLGCSIEAAEGFVSAFSAAGRVEYIDEKLMDAASAVSGCGPAFVYMFIEALADGGVECGLPRDKALALAAQTVSGAAEMVISSGEHPGKLKDNVCSPGGTTIAGVHALEEGRFRATSMNSVKAAFDKTKKLG